ncbi:MAG TPA: dihydroneopterin aldolase [Ignavibacteriaceae bacterium]|jgi:dihydroneopterin aldolase|nr:dihydroneopterin aldolase [Ignavibacteriaceae bacterium]
MKNIIRINKASFYAYHGVFRGEQNVGGKFEADIVIHTDFTGAAKTDRLKQTIDYEEVYKLLTKLAMNKKFYLIEALAAKIVEELFRNFVNILEVEVRVRKNNPPIGGVVDCVEVEVSMNSEEFKNKYLNNKHNQ